MSLRILVAPDSFKDCLSSGEVANSIEEGILLALPDAIIEKVPLADGGEGTVEAMIEATGGKIFKARVHDPLMRLIDSCFGVLGDGKTAVIGMSAASGLELLTKNERNPAYTTTYGTGELIKATLDLGCENLIIGIGGSATNDGGAGMLRALGIKLLDKCGNEVQQGGQFLLEIASIDTSQFDKRLAKTRIKLACDVTNPLYGARGAAYTYAQQKGATPEMVMKLDRALEHYAEILKAATGKDVSQIPGSGAAGGIAAGMMAFMEVTIVPGAELIMETLGLEEKIKHADIIITGEGMIDGQTLFGKAPFRVAQMAKKYSKPVVGIAGSIAGDYEQLFKEGFLSILSIMDKPMTLNDGIKDAKCLIRNTSENIIRLFAGR
ncbi:MAG: glycerate kinase [Bacteroidales bacterium]|nr:glycerate kinase [Bacteroidales bacterium]